MSFLSRIIARTFVRLKYVNLINILLDKEVVPELLLENCKPHLILPHLMKALNDTEFRSKQQKDFKAASITMDDKSIRDIMQKSLENAKKDFKK